MKKVILPIIFMTGIITVASAAFDHGTRKSKIKKVVLAILLTAGFMAAASAADTASMNVTASVTSVCKFTAYPDVGFGALDPSSASAATATSNIQFYCTKGATYSLAVGTGSNYDKTAVTRRMKGPGVTDYIPYTLSLASTTGIGTGKSTPITVVATGNIANADYVNVSTGAYSDIVSLTITP
jgi:spore coat protein U-like protein